MFGRVCICVSLLHLLPWLNACGISHRDLVHDVLRTAVNDVLNDVALQRSDDYPRRFRPTGVASFVATAPEVRPQGGRVHGLGWSHPLPAGWAFDPTVGESGGARSRCRTWI
jgi:hypothetical protein